MIIPAVGYQIATGGVESQHLAEVIIAAAVWAGINVAAYGFSKRSSGRREQYMARAEAIRNGSESFEDD